MYFMCIIMVQLGAVGIISILEMRTRSIKYIASGHLVIIFLIFEVKSSNCMDHVLFFPHHAAYVVILAYLRIKASGKWEH